MKRRITLVTLGILLFICMIVSASYAWYGYKEDTTNIQMVTTLPTCVSMSLSGDNGISITGDLATSVSDAKALNTDGYRYSFTISNNCAASSSDLYISLVFGSSNTIDLSHIKYAIYESTGTKPTEGTVLSSAPVVESADLNEASHYLNDTITSGYRIVDTSLGEGETKTYYLYLWIKEDANDIGAVFSTNLMASSHKTTPTTLAKGTNLASGITSLVGKSGTYQENSIDYNWEILNEEVTVNENTYINTIYTGANPNNYVDFNGELWRIIGVYNEDTHGQTGKRLVKIIKNDSLGSFSWDYKQNGVGSSTSDNGSNEWSDSQIMFMLNGPGAINKGKLYDGTQISEYTTSVDGDYIVDKNNNKIMKISNGNYLTEIKETNKTVYVPATATTSLLTETTGTLSSTLSSESQNMIEEVTWHLGGLNSNSNGANPSELYNFERGNGICGTYGNDEACTASTSSNLRSTTWTGKIGLMYPSDYGYATNGGSTYDRNTCLAYNMGNWHNENYQTDCAYNSWLLNYNATNSTQGIHSNSQWVLTSYALSNVSPFYLTSLGRMLGGYASARNSFEVRPTVYLKDTITVRSGDGSYNNPYKLA